MTYLFPSSVEEAVGMLAAASGRARIIAGGTDLLPMLREGAVDADELVDITRIAGLDGIETEGELLFVGAAATFAALRDSAVIRGRVSALAEAAASVGAAPIQAMATWVGNIVQAMPAADGGVMAVALDAEARVVDASGSRWLPVEKLYEGAKTSALDPKHSLIAQLRFAAPKKLWGAAWRRIGRRPSLTLPILNCAATLRLSEPGGPIAELTLALGPVAALPYRVREAERLLVGRQPDDDAIDEAAAIARADCHPRSNPLRASKEYREELIPTLVRSALREARRMAAV